MKVAKCTKCGAQMSVVPGATSVTCPECDTTFRLKSATSEQTGAGQNPPTPPHPAQQSGSNQPSSPVAPLPAAEDVVRCPKCGSAQISADKKGFSAGKGCCLTTLALPLVGILAPLALVCGFSGAGKIMVTCLSCGHHWLAGRQ